MRHFRRRRTEDGAAAVEFALLFPIFMVLAMGIIAAGTAFSRQINITQAAREASRYGATLDISTQSGTGVTARTDNWLTAVDDAARQAAGNSANPIGGYDYRCVALVVTNGAGAPTTGSRYRANGGAATSGACPSTSAAAIPNTTYVQVVFSRNVKMTMLFINPVVGLDAVSTTPYERTVA